MEYCYECGAAISFGYGIVDEFKSYHNECYDMSMRDKLGRAAAKGAQEAIKRERDRCLWCLDGILERLQEDFDKKILIEQQRHVAEIKLNLAKAVVGELRTAIVMGIGSQEEKKDE